jgi:hypothetical protein
MPKITIELSEDEYHELNDAYIGFCRGCGAEHDGCEPDARNYPCEECGANAVFGLEELLMMGEVEIMED